MSDSTDIITVATAVLFVGGLWIYPTVRAWRSGHKGWAFAILVLTPVYLIGTQIAFFSLLANKDNIWLFEKGWLDQEKAELEEKRKPKPVKRPSIAPQPFAAQKPSIDQQPQTVKPIGQFRDIHVIRLTTREAQPMTFYRENLQKLIAENAQFSMLW